MCHPRTILVLPLLLMHTGCLLSYRYTDTVRREEDSRTISFESEVAERLFAEALEKRKAAGLDVASTTINVPLLVSWTDAARLSDAAFFNDQVKICDADNNGVLTDAEVAAYHKRVTGKDDPLGLTKRILHQEGDVKITPSKKTYDVQFPQTYLSAPELTLSPDAAQKGLVEPTAEGFRITFKEAPPSFTVHWQANGRPFVPHGSFSLCFGCWERGPAQ